MNTKDQTKELQQKIVRGDAHALDHLYRLYFGKLKYYGLHFGPSLPYSSIEDLIQELFIWIATNRSRLAHVRDMDVYLFSALKKNINRAISKNIDHNQSTQKFFSSLPNKPTTSPSVEEVYINQESTEQKKSRIKQLLEQLPLAQREVLYLKNYASMSYKEIGEVMNLSEQVVRNYSYRGLQKLRDANKESMNSRNNYL